ncbi:MAG: 1,4-dihydroxy-2-naphthoate octaprenyltransferase [candidate division KSB1 bacterium]|nr:1,4-dihydroxy-2-naphthoate octaprenyltransferase [candidate division KSB1 bacterium]MDZ7356198.1 1,4-dihydroxy-2-naphthoate octaprenyltransferase [candidate division KSB1 bacterium]MDZ7375704.1 1,4-dihydroxy-2-naphthoate octaprenyltransferase [candidate division KSB1 bacterium]MDZ7400341.1 1,4-dihydroxy-2-naphthoate octaprenyltransferase [candidate division KSB1 bacterium]
MQKVKYFLLEVRAPFFSATIVPIVLGSVIAFNMTQQFHWVHFILALIGGIFLHAGANVINDYFDHLSSNDVINEEYVRPFTGGSRLIQQGLLTPREVLVEAMVCLFLGSCIGLYLAYRLGWVILAIGVFGVFSAIFYVFPRINLVGRGVGEALIGINFGILMTFGAFYVQTGIFSWVPIIASLPVALLITAVLYINEFQDAKADQAVGKNHLVVRLGKKQAVSGYILIMLLTYVIVVVAVVIDILPPISLIALLTMPLALKSIRIAQQNYNNSLKLVPANAGTIMNHLFTGLLLIISFFLDRII